MGQDQSSERTQAGVPVNPRLQYASSLASREKKQNHVLLDAPSLVKLQHGTVRYRFKEDEHKGDLRQRIEKPHEGVESLDKKGGYFYHPKFKDYSDSVHADSSKREDWKFCYIYKGAERTRQKQLFYVFGKGLRTDENGIVTPKYQGEDGDAPEKFYKFHGHYYYNVQEFVEETNLDEDDGIYKKEEDLMVLGDGNVDNAANDVKVQVKKGENVLRLSRRLAIKMHKPAAHFHFYKDGQELQGETLLHSALMMNKKKPTFCALLKAI